jgi:formylglycine-generating enzyme required for sulfatase activity
MIGASEKTTAWLSNEFSDYISDVRTFQKNKREFESPVFKATITKGYWIGKYEITNRQWKATIPSTGRNKVVKYPMYPKTNITWEEANQYCKALTELLGVTVRLPTEIEWEYAARSGTEETNDKNQLLSYHVRKSNGPISVTRCLRNNWGVYGMLENVSEWCLDYYAPYTSQDVVDRTIKSVQEDFKRIIRGGNFKYNVHSAIASFRDGFPPNKSDPCIGLRVVILDNPPLNYFQIK